MKITIAIAILAWLALLFAPIKWPCNYGSYRAWWRDRRNWRIRRR